MTRRCQAKTKSGNRCKRQINGDKRRKYCYQHSRSQTAGGLGDVVMGATRAIGNVAGRVPALGKAAQLATGASLRGQERFFGLFEKER